MNSNAQKYCINGGHFSVEEIENESTIKVGEERAIARAVIDWHKGHRFVFYTSGSTGNPKEISFSKEQVKASINLSRIVFWADLQRYLSSMSACTVCSRQNDAIQGS